MSPTPVAWLAASAEVELKLNRRAPMTYASLASLRASTMSTAQAVSFSDVALHRKLDPCSTEDLDEVDFGVVGIGVTDAVQRYSSFESKVAGLSSQRVLGQPLFTVVDAEVKCEHRCRWTKAAQTGTLNLTYKLGWPLLSS